MLLPLVINLGAPQAGVSAGGNILGLLFPLDIDIAPTMRVQATAIGDYNGILYGPGDVFDIDSRSFSDSTIDYSAGGTGGPFFGWMKQVPASTPLSRPDIPLYDFSSKRRTVF
jgi:hypothetical protein